MSYESRDVEVLRGLDPVKRRQFSSMEKIMASCNTTNAFTLFRRPPNDVVPAKPTQEPVTTALRQCVACHSETLKALTLV